MSFKTKKAICNSPIENDLRKGKKITCTSSGETDPFNKTIWYDDKGCAYELCYARLARVYYFIPYPYYDKKYCTQ